MWKLVFLLIRPKKTMQVKIKMYIDSSKKDADERRTYFYRELTLVISVACWSLLNWPVILWCLPSLCVDLTRNPLWVNHSTQSEDIGWSVIWREQSGTFHSTLTQFLICLILNPAPFYQNNDGLVKSFRFAEVSFIERSICKSQWRCADPNTLTHGLDTSFNSLATSEVICLFSLIATSLQNTFYLRQKNNSML